MASGILGGGSLTQNVSVNPYTTPTGKITTATLLVTNTGTVAVFNLQMPPVNMDIVVPSSGIFTMSGIILGGGQSVSIMSYSTTLKYMLTGWESQV